MPEKKQLFELIKDYAGKKVFAGTEIPAYITENLRYHLFDWQRDALKHFLIYHDPENDLIPDPAAAKHLLFNMATGTGKTLLMAALILYYYKQGYRNFIFFVNQNNIVGKTEENLVNPQHSKYLFKNPIIIDDKTVQVKKVETFSAQTEDIEILFTTVHALHNSVYTIKENCVYLDDLQKRNLIMLGDEAHHLNADTKKKKGEQLELDELHTELKGNLKPLDLEKSWENTVCKKMLERKQAKEQPAINKNVLLEFTATVPKAAAVKEKYSDKIIFKFDLPEFLKAGYTKEINLVTSNAGVKQIILQALLFNWYRDTIAFRNGLSNFKPVILFRSKTIADSLTDYASFQLLIDELSEDDFDFLYLLGEQESCEGKEIYLKGKSRIMDVKRYILEKEIDFQEIIDYLKYSFRSDHCIITNSKDKSAKGKRGEEKTTEEQDKLLNSLEDRDNQIRAIFTVQRLNEGWDVLNLFDIVRLYKGRDEGKARTGERKAGPATTSEVQLIGRGVRYYPFSYGDEERLKRKFDYQLDHEMRVLEEFYFHSYDDDKNRYIDELKRELKDKGFIDESKKIKTFGLKDSFVSNPFYRQVKIWMNTLQDNPDARKKSLDEIRQHFAFLHPVKAFRVHEEGVVLDEKEDKEKYTSASADLKTLSTTFKEFEKHIIMKAINRKAAKEHSLFRYKNLKHELSIDSVDELLKEQFIGDLPINISMPAGYSDMDALPNEYKLDALLAFFDVLESHLREISNPYIGTPFEEGTFAAVFGQPVQRVVTDNEDSKRMEKELMQKEWYVLDSFSGTSEEIVLIDVVTETIENLKEKYDTIYLIRNDRVYTMYDFKKGRKFQPDFLLFLKVKEQDNYLQIFIEPKGDQFKDASGNFSDSKEGWKELFLDDISRTEPIEFEYKSYKLIGMPFFNEKKKEDFRRKYKETLHVS